MKGALSASVDIENPPSDKDSSSDGGWKEAQLTQLLLRRTWDEVKARVGTKRLGDADAFGGLIVLQEGCDDTRQSQGTPVERVYKLNALLSVTIATTQAVGLIALEVGDGAHLKPTLLRC